MIALLLSFAISNMPPPAPDACKKPDAGVGTACKTRNWRSGACVQSQCPKTEYGKDGSTTVTTECLVCEVPVADGGTK